ncbi:homocysteine S-methyltransferase [Secundilactobacillus hailunensis]|uniref:Homocysteine S-methyltransferase n=1 Tax=Secundilactobacillus hailunensis TaxID=2559923 RepID=A0ABW1T6A5_9LACO|nr:homocysteine S-methyltransferase [Secundilactobacillus hailunensis]
MNNDLIKNWLEKQSALVVDGAMATELEKRGVDTNNELWSAMALVHDPDAVVAVHRSYFDAGANIAITDSYQANIPAFKKAGLTQEQSGKMIFDSVKLAQRARADYVKTLPEDARQTTPLLIAGSVGPYGAYLANGSEYTGDYSLTDREYKDFHRARMNLLAGAGIDLFAFETQPNFAEAKALADLSRNEFAGIPAWLSFSVTAEAKLCDGTPLTEAVTYFNQFPNIIAIGVNCTAMTNIEVLIKVIAKVTDKPIVVYPNNGDTYDPVTKTWESNPNARSFSELAPKWQAAGASLIGGCCRTTPVDIQEIAASVIE